MKKYFYFALCGAFALYSCKSNTVDNHANEAQEEHDHEHGENIIELSEDKAVAAGVKWATIAKEPFHSVIIAGGQITSAQGDESVVVATVPGVVRLKNNLVEGSSVQNGQTLVSISSRNIQDGDPAQRARINYEIAKKEYERVLPLVDSKIVSQKDFVKIKQDYENARLSYEASAKGYTKDGQQVKSPLGGFIKSILVKEGDFVEVGQPLMSVTQSSRLFLKAEVSERYYSQLKNVQSANFKYSYQPDVYKLSDLGGQVISYGKASADQEYLIPITFSFKNIGEMVPGSFVEVFLLSKDFENSLVLPYTAITEEQGLYFAYKKVCVEEYEKVEVKLGPNNGEKVQILSGINEGDVIVTHGAQQLKLASASNSIPAHTHEH